MPLDSAESIRRWDAYASQWASISDPEEGDRNREVLLNPALFALLGDVAGKRVLDAGCGEGYLSRRLARLGARVTAIDAAPAMIEIARERTPADLGVDLGVADAERLDEFADASFDVVVSNMVLIDLADYEAAIRAAFRVLVPGGACVCAITHPCFGTPGAHWAKNEKGERLHWVADHYFAEGPREEQLIVRLDGTLIQFHRTLTSYVRAIIAAGFVIEDLVEPKPSPEAIAKHPGFAHDLRMCHFILFRLRKGEPR